MLLCNLKTTPSCFTSFRWSVENNVKDDMIIMENLIPKVANNEAVTTILPDAILGFCVH